MTGELEWIYVYGKKKTLFVDGRARGDYYQATDGVFRVRLWPPYRLQGGREVLVRSEEQAEALLLEMLQASRQAEAESV